MTAATIELHTPETAGLDAEAVAAATYGPVAAVMSEFGIPGEPKTSCRQWAREDVGVTINGRTWRVQRPMVDRLAVHAGADLAAASQVERLGALAASIAARWPGELLSQTAAQAVSRKLARGLDGAGGQLSAVLAGALRAGAPIRDVDAVSRTLADLSADADPAVRAEALVAALCPNEAEVLLPSSDLRQLSAAGQDERGAIADMVGDVEATLGLPCPPVGFAVDDALAPRMFRLRVRGVARPARRGLGSDEVLVLAPAAVAREAGIRAEGLQAPRGFASIVASADAVHAASLGWTVRRPLEHIADWLAVELRVMAPWLIDRDYVREELDWLDFSYPTLGQALRDHVTEMQLIEVLRVLASEAVPIQNLRRIVEALVEFDWVLADACRMQVFDDRLPVRSAPGPGWLADPLNLATFVRMRLGHASTDADRGQRLTAVVVEPEMQDLLWDPEIAPSESRNAVDAELWIDAFNHAVADGPAQLVVCAPDVRGTLRSRLSGRVPAPDVVSAAELSYDADLDVVGRVNRL